MPNSTHLDIDDVFSMGYELQNRRKSTTQTTLNSTLKDSNSNYTNRAIISFVDSVNKMNEEVLVPSRLKDLEVREQDSNELMPQNIDLYSLYSMLNKIQKDLFSSKLYYKTFQSISGQQQQQSSSQNSGRVTPTLSLSRRSSYSLASGIGGGGGVGGGNGTQSPNGTNSPNGILNGNSNRTSPTLLLPPTTLQLERKLSSPCVMSRGLSDNNGGDYSGETSPELLSPTNATTGSGTGSGAGGGNGSTLLLPSLSLSYVSRATSLSSLLAASGNQLSMFDNGEPLSSEEHCQQITGCFMYHLSALYTMMGHFTKAANYITKRYQEEMENVC